MLVSPPASTAFALAGPEAVHARSLCHGDLVRGGSKSGHSGGDDDSGVARAAGDNGAAGPVLVHHAQMTAAPPLPPAAAPSVSAQASAARGRHAAAAAARAHVNSSAAVAAGAGAAAPDATPPVSWSLVQVGALLARLGLSEYTAAFVSNLVTGAELLDLTADDLTYLGVTILAHRKALARAIELLKRG